MKPFVTRIPDDTKWIWIEVDGKKTGAATLPASEVLTIFTMAEYLTAQLAACNAVNQQR